MKIMSRTNPDGWNQQRKLSSLLFIMLSIPTICWQAEKPKKPGGVEQSHFSAEQDVPGLAVKRPVEVPESVLQILRTDERILMCIKDENLTPETVSASWFVGSEVHLDGADEIDLVVLPRLPQKELTEHRCLFGANIDPFWVFRKTPQNYELVLSVATHDLDVLGTRSKGYRDIRTYSITAKTIETTDYCFNGRKYEVIRHATEPIR